MNTRYVSNLPGGRTEFTRGINKISFSSATGVGKRSEGDGKFQNFKHDAIDDAIIERTSTVLDCDSGKWITGVGAD